MCRVEAQEACARAEEMKAAGASRIVALVKEDVGTEVADFRAGYWSEEVFLDSGKSFFLALGGGRPHKPISGVAALLAILANPFTTSRTKGALGYAKRKGVAQNLTGEGFIAGGIYVIRQDGKASYKFLEEDMGDKAPVDDVIEAVKAAVRGEEYLAAPLQMPGSADEGSRRKTWKEWAGRTSGPDGYQIGDIARGIAASVARCRAAR